MEEKYTIIDRIKAFSLRHRTIVVLLLTAIVMTALGAGVTYSIYKNNLIKIYEKLLQEY